MDTDPRAECTACGATLDPYDAAPCPKCGRTDTKKVYKTIQGRVVPTATVDRTRIRTWLKLNWWAIALLILVTVIQPFVCLALRGLLAIVTSAALSAAGLVVGFFAMVKTREIEHHI